MRRSASRRSFRTGSTVHASLRTTALWMGSASDSETKVVGFPLAQADHETVIAKTNTADLTNSDSIRKIPYVAARSYSALNSQPTSAIREIRYIQTSSAMPAPIDPYITL